MRRGGDGAGGEVGDQCPAALNAVEMTHAKSITSATTRMMEPRFSQSPMLFSSIVVLRDEFWRDPSILVVSRVDKAEGSGGPHETSRKGRAGHRCPARDRARDRPRVRPRRRGRGRELSRRSSGGRDGAATGSGGGPARNARAGRRRPPGGR